MADARRGAGDAKAALAHILDGPDTLSLAMGSGAGPANEEPAGSPGPAEGPPGEPRVAPGFCVECTDQPAALTCETCADDFCDVCWESVHRRGTRRRHVTKRHDNGNGAAVKDGPGGAPKKAHSDASSALDDADMEDMTDSDDPRSPAFSSSPTSLSFKPDYFVEKAKYIPLRLTLEERRYLRLLEAALTVSEYTDKIDIIYYSNKPRRIVGQIKELCAILSGLVLAADYKAGQELFKDRAFEDNEVFFQDIFELGRRHKISSPERMRVSYGKLIYMLQDSQMPEVLDMLQFNSLRSLKTVHSVLVEGQCKDLLSHELMSIATMEIISEGRPRHEVQADIKRKEKAVEFLARKFGGRSLSPDMIKTTLYSFGDYHSFLRYNRDPCDKMIDHLHKFFRPDSYDKGFSLAITSGRGGARISHDHQKQFNYVSQSLTLWREILNDMFMLWHLTEADLLDSASPYRLRDTGQGLNRVQGCPRIHRAMQVILSRAQKRVGHWVGSSVLHVGDSAVPNAFHFIDKYTQISRFLLPIARCIYEIDNMVKTEGIRTYIDSTFGGAESLKKIILCDFYKHGFDGSGADNFFDAGSCIDGRLTSAWNWCALIEKKPFWPVFQLSGFNGFDGKFE